MGRGPNSRTGCTYIFFLQMDVEYIQCINVELVAMQFIAIRHNSFQGQDVDSMYMKTNSAHFLLQVFHPTGQHIYVQQLQSCWTAAPLPSTEWTKGQRRAAHPHFTAGQHGHPSCWTAALYAAPINSKAGSTTLLSMQQLPRG